MTRLLSEAELAALAAGEGLSRTATPGHVLVLGAGMAGLMAAYQLERHGHRVTIIEGRTRVGGRIETLRDPFSHGLFAEAGAMRLPASHRLTHWLIQHVGLGSRLRPFDETPAFFLFGEARVGGTAPDREMSALFELNERERAIAGDVLWANAWRGAVFGDGGQRPWAEIERDLGGFSVRRFLEEASHTGWSPGAIERFGLMYNYESLMESSVVELLREEAGEYYHDLSYLDGGMDQLPVALAGKLAAEIRFGARVVAIAYSREGVAVSWRDTAGNVREPVRGDFAVVTLPLPVLRFVEFTPRLPVRHYSAIRQLHYDAATKVFLQVRERFWERLPPAFRGGQVATDRPIRNLYYPPHGAGTGRGVVLASYTWGDDAQGWGSLSPASRLAEATEQMVEVHDGIPGLGDVGELVEGGASKSWHDDEFAGGAYALFDPGQHGLLDPLREPAGGRVFFAGEHLSTKHAWVQGSLESGIQAASDVDRAAAALNA